MASILADVDYKNVHLRMDHFVDLQLEEKRQLFIKAQNTLCKMFQRGQCRNTNCEVRQEVMMW